MRILQISSARSVGGGERHVADLSNALAARRGHEIFTALAPGSPLAEKLRAVSRENVFFARMRNALDVSSIFELKKIIEQNDVEIVHAHLARDYPLAAFAARLSANKPCFALTRHVLFPLNRLHKFALKNASGVIAVSRAVAASLNKQKIFPPEKIKLIHNGIDTDYFSPVERAANPIFRVGTIGQITTLKGQIDFVRAAAIVLEKRSDVEFEIVGADQSRTGENRHALEKSIAELNLQNKIHLRGWQADVRLFLRVLNLFVSPSRFDSFGLALAEAMACGVAVVATETEGAREIVEHGASGILVPIENAEKLAQAILNLSDDKEKRNALAAAGRQRICENFSLEKMVAETEEFYFQILAPSAR